MSLRNRIALLIGAVSTIIVTALFFVQLDNVIEARSRSSLEIAGIAGEQIKHLLIVRLEEQPEASWMAALAGDRRFAQLLETTMARAHAILEISIAGRNGVTIVSSNPMRPGHALPAAPDLRELAKLHPLRRAYRVLRDGNAYQTEIPLGFAGQTKPVLTVQVLVSPVLLRADLVPAMKGVAQWGAAALLVSALLAYVSATLAVSNLPRLGRVIDRISQGEDPADAPETREPEFAVLESKLKLLGRQVRGAKEHEEQMRGHVEKLLDGLEEAILLFNSERRLLLFGGAARRTLGLCGDEAAGRKLEELFPEHTSLGAVIGHAFEHRQNVKDCPVAWANGGIAQPLLLNVEFLRDPGEPGGFNALVRVRDAGGREKLESELGLSARLDAMNKITSSVAHEIKNPLNAIAARLDYLQSWAAGEFPDAEREIESIFQEVNRLDRVVRTFLDFTKPVELAHQRIDVVELAADVAQLLTPDAARREVSVGFASSASHAVVLGDEDLLKEALLNLATNGIEAMPRGGELNIAVTQANNRCRVSIRDTGIGIPKLLRDKIFQLYFTTKQNGSGLGLPMAYRAAELHGGALRLENEAGPGACFSLELPLTEVAQSR